MAILGQDRTKKKPYRASSKICKGCTYYREEYQRNIERVNSPLGKYMKGKRQSTVEPVFGTLPQLMGLGEGQHIGIGTSQQGDAPLGNRL